MNTTNKSYTISYSQGDQYIQCHTCGRPSFNPDDIKNRYCGNCRKFHDSPDDLQVTEEDGPQKRGKNLITSGLQPKIRTVE